MKLKKLLAVLAFGGEFILFNVAMMLTYSEFVLAFGLWTICILGATTYFAWKEK